MVSSLIGPQYNNDQFWKFSQSAPAGSPNNFDPAVVPAFSDTFEVSSLTLLQYGLNISISSALMNILQQNRTRIDKEQTMFKRFLELALPSFKIDKIYICLSTPTSTALRTGRSSTRVRTPAPASSTMRRSSPPSGE